MKKLTILGICLLAPSLLGAEPRTGSARAAAAAGYFFPAATNAAGAFGATFRTRLVLTNPSPVPLSVVATLSTPTGPGGVQTIALGPSVTVVYPNVLADVFGYAGAGGLHLAESTGSLPFYAVGEVYSESAGGRFSTPLVAMSADDRVVNGFLTELGTSASTGLFVDASNRANFGCANMDGTQVAVRADIYDETSGTVPASTVNLGLLPYGWAQQSVPVTGQVIRIQFTQLSAGGLYGSFCWGVNVNNQSNDGTLSPALWAPPR